MTTSFSTPLSRPTSDLRTDCLEVPNILTVHKDVVGNRSFANDVIFGSLTVSNTISGNLIIENNTQLSVLNAQPPLSGTGEPGDPLDYLPMLLQPLAFLSRDEVNMIGNPVIGPLVYLETVPVFGGWGPAKPIPPANPAANDYIQRITVEHETSGLIATANVSETGGIVVPLPAGTEFGVQLQMTANSANFEMRMNTYAELY